MTSGNPRRGLYCGLYWLVFLQIRTLTSELLTLGAAFPGFTAKKAGPRDQAWEIGACGRALWGDTIDMALR